MSIRVGPRVGPRSGARVGANVGYGPSLPSPISTVLTENQSTVDGASVATASITPVANQVVYAAIAAYSAVSLVAPTATGNGLTWVQVATIALDANRQLTVFRAQGATPSAGAITFDFGGVTQTSFIWSVIQYSGADASGTNGSGATGQSKTGQVAAALTLGVTLNSALVASTSRMLAFVATSSTVVTSDSDFTRLTERSTSANTQRLESEHAIGQTNCTCSWSPSQAAAMVALEVKAA